METVPRGHFSLSMVRRFVEVSTDALASAREEIDALNVYPIPDGDTGTNMFLTMSAGREAIVGSNSGEAAVALRAFARGMLMGARGNSGVIVSQMLGAWVERLMSAEADPCDPRVIAEAVRDAADAGYAAVGRPVEGTMLTVARVAATAATRAGERDGAQLRDVIAAAAAAAREAVCRTPEQLQVLRDAGVVDAGGRGLSIVFDAAEQVVTGRRMPLARPIPRPIPAGPSETGPDRSADGLPFEVMYLLDDATDETIPDLRAALLACGDSVVVVGGRGLWNVHVHTADVGAAIEAGIAAGRPHRIRVTHFADSTVDEPAVPSAERAVVAVAAGPGLARLFEEAGAHVLSSGTGRRPSTDEVAAAIRASGGAQVVVLPNDLDSIRVAELAARLVEESGGIRVVVIHTSTQVQGLAAMAVHEPGRPFDADVLEMTATARHARDGAVTVASRRAMTMAGPCEPGDVLGVIAGDFAVIGDDLDIVARTVIDRLLGAGGELLTLVAGESDGGPGGLAARCEVYAAASYRHVDVAVYDGGQQRYALLIGVE
ncbi:MAG: DAK2 domain-containing protein [Nocardioides sp.]